MASKRLANNDGAQDALLNSVKASFPNAILNGLSDKEKSLVQAIVNNIISVATANNQYTVDVASTSINASLGRIASLLDEVKDDFTTAELADVKTAIVDEVKTALQELPRDNITIDIEQLTNAVADKIQELQDNIITEIQEQFEQFIAQNANAQSAQVKEQTTEKEEKEEKTEEPKEEAAAEEKTLSMVEKMMNEVNAQAKADSSAPAAQNIDYTKALRGISDAIDKCNMNISNIVIMVNASSDIISTEIDILKLRLDRILSTVGRLFPSKKDKKDQKNQKNAINNINNAIQKLLETVEKINSFCDNFVEYLAKNFKTLLDKIFKVFVSFWLKLMLEVIAPTLVILGACLYLLAKPLMDVLKPLLDFIDSVIGKVLDFLAPIRDFLLDVMKRIFDAIEPALVAFFKGLAAVAEQVAIGLGLFVTSVLNVLKLLMDGIATGAFALGQALVVFATTIVNVLALFMKGLSSSAEAIGRGLGKFVTVCLDVLTLLMEGFGTKAKEIGEAIAKVVLAVCNVVALLVQFLEECVGILVAIVGTIRDFFEGIRSKAKAIGEMVGDIMYNFFKGFNTKAEAIGEAVAEFVLETAKFMTKIMKALNNFNRIIEMQLMAPFKGLQLKFRGGLAKMADYSGWGSGVVHGIANAFGWGSLSKDEQEEARAAQTKSIKEIVQEQQAKLKARYDAEDKAEQLRKLNDKIQQQKIQDMLNSIHVLDDIFKLLKDIHAHLLGEEKSTAALSVQAVQPNVEQLENIQNKEQETKDNLQENLEKEKQQAAQQMKQEQKPKNQDNFKETLMSYLEEKFKNVIDKLDSPPQVMPIPLQSGLGNAASLEDM